MALIVEDGTVVAGSECLCTLAFTTAYHLARGNASWAALASDTIREQHKRKAADYMRQKYRTLWAGWRISSAQALDWPRTSVPLPDVFGSSYGAYVPIDSIPSEVQLAESELALRSIAGDLLGDTTQQVTREKIGPIEVDYDKFSAQDTRYAAIDAMLRPYLAHASGALKMVRA